MRSKGTLAIALAFLCGVMIFFNYGDYIAAFRSPVDFNELAAEEISENMRVEGDIYAILDSFANEETWTENKNGSRSAKKTSHIYYIIPVGEAEYMGLSAIPKEFSGYEAVMSATYDYMMDAEAEYIDAEPVHFVGKTTKMEKELYGYFAEWFQENEYFNTTELAVIETYVVPVMLETRNWTAVYVIFAVNVAMLLGLILWLILWLRGRKKEKAQAGQPVNIPYVAVPNAPAPGGAPVPPADPAQAAGQPAYPPAASYETPDSPDASGKGGPRSPDQP